MTIRDAKRPLAGPFGWEDPDIVRGRYTTGEYDRFVYMRPRGGAANRVDMGGEIVVSVNLKGGRSGTRTYTDPEEIRALANDLHEVANWLAREKAKALHEALVRAQQEEGGQ